MQKIKVYEGTELNVENGASNSCISIITGDLTIVDAYVKALTKENLSHAVITNEEGNVTSNIKDKYLYGFDGNQVIESTDYIVCSRLADVYTLEERIAMLEAENEALKASQEIQDEAIVELADIIAE